jgi:hypothetical protein
MRPIFRIRNYAAAAVLALLAACDTTQMEPVVPPPAINPDIIISVNGNTHVIKTPSIQNANWGFALIGSSGGSVSVSGHTLRVPAGAVSQATWFMMQVVESNTVHVKLKAWRAWDGAAVTQFPNVPVKLTLDARNLGNLDPAGLQIVYLRDGRVDGELEAVPSVFDPNAWKVTGVLTHFSSYALAKEFSPGID